jgi:hypothetical protein
MKKIIEKLSKKIYNILCWFGIHTIEYDENFEILDAVLNTEDEKCKYIIKKFNCINCGEEVIEKIYII